MTRVTMNNIAAAVNVEFKSQVMVTAEPYLHTCLLRRPVLLVDTRQSQLLYHYTG